MAVKDINSTDETLSNDLDPRDARALTQHMTVLPEGGSLFSVTSQSGNEYTVDAKRGRCECDDMAHNLPDGDREECKHLARVRFATGERAIPSWVNMDRVHDLLGYHLDRAEPRIMSSDDSDSEDNSPPIYKDCPECSEIFVVTETEPRQGACIDPDCGATADGAVATDGGMFGETVRGRYETERVDGGVLVYDRDIDEDGRELVGFTDVDDWSALRESVGAQGHGVGAIHHKEVFEHEEVGL
jgi:hypothetical protein